MDRREFFKTALAVAALGLGKDLIGVPATERSGEMIYRTLGKTGEKISAIGLGGFHVGKQPDAQESIKIIQAAIDGGITFLDNCWDYNNGESERRMGKALQNGYRSKVFLMTKIDGRNKKTAEAQITESLQRLQTDHIDLMQLHEIIRMSDPDRVFEKGGAIEALIEARNAGKIRFIGFTGHKSPDIHLKMLSTAATNGFRFDTVQMPLNVMDAHFNSFQMCVLPELTKDQIGVLGMKPMGDNFIMRSKTVSAVECLHYAMNLPVSTILTGIDSMEILEQALHAAKTFHPLEKTEIDSLLARTAKRAAAGEFELYKTSDHFDGTAHNPQWMG